MVGPLSSSIRWGRPIRGGKRPGRSPTPHIGLATVTYLFEGEIIHRDSLGTLQPIRSGRRELDDRGKGHCPFRAHGSAGASDRRRTVRYPGLGGAAARGRGDRAHLRSPPREALPVLREKGMEVRLIAGTLFGLRSPVETLWDTLYADAALQQGARLAFPAEHEERAVYPVGGDVETGRPSRRAWTASRSAARSSWSRSPPGLPPGCCCWAGRRWMGRDRSGGTSFPARASASSRRRPIGKPDASPPCQEKPSSFLCPRADAASIAVQGAVTEDPTGLTTVQNVLVRLDAGRIEGDHVARSFSNTIR